MNDRLHEILAQCAVIHQENIQEGIIFELEKVEDKLENYEDDIQEHYLTLLMQYYFQQNFLEGLQALLLQGFKFEMRFEDIKEAILHIKDDSENVIEFYEDSVVMLKDVLTDEQLKAMYDYYHESEPYKDYLNPALDFIRKNRYVCAHAYKSKEEYAKFFLNSDLLDSLKRDLPYLLK